jgi:hypothetical protein
MKNAREKAIEWWNKLPIIEKSLLAQKYSDALFGRGYTSLTGREIEAIWVNEIGLAKIENEK